MTNTAVADAQVLSNAKFSWMGAGDEYDVVRVKGREQLGRPYRFEVLFVSGQSALTEKEITDLRKSPCTLRLSKDAKVHGVVHTVQRLFRSQKLNTVYRYRVELVPQIERLAHNRRTRIFQNRDGTPKHASLAEVSKWLCLEWRLTANWPADEAALLAAGTAREFLIQYDESDLKFLHRYLAKDGAYYWFEHRDKEEEERVRFSRRNAAEPTHSLTYVEDNETPLAGEHPLTSFKVRERYVPKEVVAIDYNYCDATKLVGKKENVLEPDRAANSIGGRDEWRGTVCAFRSVGAPLGEHGQGAAQSGIDPALLAGNLAHGYAVRATTYGGVTGALGLRAGSVFTVKNAESAFDGDEVKGADKFLVISAKTKFDIQKQEARVKFRAVRCDGNVEFRNMPTPDTLIPGTLQAKVVSATASCIDEDYRYKVQLLCDTGGAYKLESNEPESVKGRAEISVRLAQPSSGSGFGMHSPPQRGTEVLLAFMHGAPDCPVIVGTVPNSETPSVVTAHNHEQSIWSTPGKSRIELSDVSPPAPAATGSGEGHG